MLLRASIAVSCCACTTGSPLSRTSPQIAVRANPGGLAGVDAFTLSLTTWNELDVLRDAIVSGEITATLDGGSLVLDPAATGDRDQADSYVATFRMPATKPAVAHPASSQIAIGDGETTWSVEVANLFANDLAAVGATAAGQDTFVWPSAASPGPSSSIDWACVEVDGQPSACGGDESQQQALGVSQQFITANLDGAPGTNVAVTAERSADTESSNDGPTFLVRIDDRLAASLQAR